jgi:hypothetical protein
VWARVQIGTTGIGAREGILGVDPLDVRLEDDELLGEVELTANLIVAANQYEAHMSASEIDQILGVVPRPRSGG